jgi:hypothetical protein
MREMGKGGIDHATENHISLEHHSIRCPIDNCYFGELRPSRVFLKNRQEKGEKLL